jgi:hypothetical protein
VLLFVALLLIIPTLTDLLKKEKAWKWTERKKFSFEELKRGIITTLMLKLPDFEQSFEV